MCVCVSVLDRDRKGWLCVYLEVMKTPDSPAWRSMAKSFWNPRESTAFEVRADPGSEVLLLPCQEMKGADTWMRRPAERLALGGCISDLPLLLTSLALVPGPEHRRHPVQSQASRG